MTNKKKNIRSFYNTRCINGGNSVEHTDLWMYLNRGPKIYSEQRDFFLYVIRRVLLTNFIKSAGARDSFICCKMYSVNCETPVSGVQSSC